MKSILVLALVSIAAGCAEKAPALTFHTMELKQVDAVAPKFRTVFTVEERPVLFIDGRLTYGKEVFINLQFNSQGTNVSPIKTGSKGGVWFTMGHGDLLPGHYSATLYVSGTPSAWEDFTVIR